MVAWRFRSFFPVRHLALAVRNNLSGRIAGAVLSPVACNEPQGAYNRAGLPEWVVVRAAPPGGRQQASSLAWARLWLAWGLDGPKKGLSGSAGGVNSEI